MARSECAVWSDHLINISSYSTSGWHFTLSRSFSIFPTSAFQTFYASLYFIPLATPTWAVIASWYIWCLSAYAAAGLRNFIYCVSNLYCVCTFSASALHRVQFERYKIYQQKPVFQEFSSLYRPNKCMTSRYNSMHLNPSRYNIYFRRLKIATNKCYSQRTHYAILCSLKT
jgi:hypothetical protein